MARPMSLRRTGAPAIPRRSFVWRQQDLAVDEHDALEHKQDQTRVGGGAQDQRKGAHADQKVRGERGLPARSSNGISDCAAAALIASTLAAVLLGFWEGDACGREGIL
jgi:hypothetical protein